MLNIYLGDMSEAIYHPPTYFDNMYEDEWLTNPLSVEMIADVDKSTVIGTHLIESPVLGPISPKELVPFSLQEPVYGGYGGRAFRSDEEFPYPRAGTQ